MGSIASRLPLWGIHGSSEAYPRSSAVDSLVFGEPPRGKARGTTLPRTWVSRPRLCPYRHVARLVAILDEYNLGVLPAPESPLGAPIVQPSRGPLPPRFPRRTSRMPERGPGSAASAPALRSGRGPYDGTWERLLGV